jgi:hypothetical protein
MAVCVASGHFSFSLFLKIGVIGLKEEKEKNRGFYRGL